MSSTLLKTSPYSSSYGLYGAGTVNPYASYFGPQPQQSQTHTQPQTSSFMSNLTSPVVASSPFGGTSLASGPSGGFTMNPATGVTGATTTHLSSTFGNSPFTSPGYNMGFGLNSPSNRTGSMGISGGSPPYNVIPQVAQTRIIGGVNHSGFLGATSPSFGRVSNTGNSPANVSAMFGSQVTSPNPSGRVDDPSQHHEPMHYSPHGGASPTSGHGHSAGQYQSPANSVYLPCYFLGLDQPHHYYQGASPPSPGVSGGAHSPIGSRVIGPGSFMSPPKSFKRTVLFEPKSFPESEVGENTQQQLQKPKGPPIHGFGSTEGSSTKEFLESIVKTDTPSNLNTSLSSPMGGDVHHSSTTPTSTSSSSKCWVTIFGFPAGASSFIVTNFSTLGKILEVKSTPGSNWLHIRFSNAIEARRALSRNGKVLGQSIMVGVIRSDEMVIENAEKANLSGSCSYSDLERTSTPQKSATSTSPILKERNLGSTIISSSGDLKSRIRPLATGFIPQSEQSIIPPPRSIQNVSSSARDTFQVYRDHEELTVPTASTGVLTKAMEYMFGW